MSVFDEKNQTPLMSAEEYKSLLLGSYKYCLFETIQAIHQESDMGSKASLFYAAISKTNTWLPDSKTTDILVNKVFESDMVLTKPTFFFHCSWKDGIKLKTKLTAVAFNCKGKPNIRDVASFVTLAFGPSLRVHSSSGFAIAGTFTSLDFYDRLFEPCLNYQITDGGKWETRAPIFLAAKASKIDTLILATEDELQLEKWKVVLGSNIPLPLVMADQTSVVQSSQFVKSRADLSAGKALYLQLSREQEQVLPLFV